MRQLLGLPVSTASGQRLGRVHTVHIDPEQHTVVQYVVHGRRWGIPAQEFLIAPAQVLSITQEVMTVVDNVVSVPAVAKPSAAAQVTQASTPLVTRTEE